MLYIVGMGLEEGDITMKGLKAVTDSKEVYLEDYTSVPYEVSFNTTKLPRKAVESDFLIKKAEKGTITLLVPGDPLFATTHISLVQECRKAEIPVEVIHAPSVVNTLSRTGLSPYKFGRIVTLAKPVASDAERIQGNIDSGLHTLCLVDPAIDAHQGLKVLQDMNFSGKMVVCERLGTSTEVIRYGELEKLFDIKLGKRPHCIIIPTSMQFFEEEFIQQFSTKA